MLWQPPRLAVAEHPELDFEFVARELTPMSSVHATGRKWLTADSRRHMSLDALLVNADDRTPIAAELKVGADQNAELALVQALAAAAQLSTRRQRRRLHAEYRDTFGSKEPSRLDVYVVTASAPQRGVRPKLAARAHQRASALQTSRALAPWVRRIVSLAAHLDAGALTFGLAHDAGVAP